MLTLYIRLIIRLAVNITPQPPHPTASNNLSSTPQYPDSLDFARVMSTAIKQEPNDPIKSEPSDGSLRVKRESGTASDDDDYEDAGDLDMAHGKRGLWLIKLPKFLLEQWEKIDDDEEIILGQLFVSSEEKVSPHNITGGGGSMRWRNRRG